MRKEEYDSTERKFLSFKMEFFCREVEKIRRSKVEDRSKLEIYIDIIEFCRAFYL